MYLLSFIGIVDLLSLSAFLVTLGPAMWLGCLEMFGAAHEQEMVSLKNAEVCRARIRCTQTEARCRTPSKLRGGELGPRATRFRKLPSCILCNEVRKSYGGI